MDGLFQEGENRVLRPPSTGVVIFGATGDLTQRKLLPALYNLAADDYLPSEFFIMGASRTKLSDEEFRARSRESLEKFSRRPLDPAVWEQFEGKLFYQPLDGTTPKDFDALRDRLSSMGKERQESFNLLFYLATSPSHFSIVAENLNRVGLGKSIKQGPQQSAIVVEKPFGFDLESAKQLNAELQRHFDEGQIYRIDHYLGKETVQNILVFRFANGIFEPLWSREHIDHIQVSVCESIGVGSRASYFDQSGITRDIIQNHLLQMLALVCIEPPYSLSDPDSIRDEKVKVLRSIKPIGRQDVIRAQYGPGFVDGAKVNGYHEENGVLPGSTTETYAAMRLEIDNWRWSGVPIYIRAGKRLPRRITEIAIYFNHAPAAMFQGRLVSKLEQNYLAIQVQPEEGISFCINSKPPGPRMRAKSVLMDFQYHDSFALSSPEAYERLLLDAMKRDATLFTRNDEIEESWALLEPVFGYWQKGQDTPAYGYEGGTWGPKEADDLLARYGHKWRLL
ncbi:MAG: glucose-6-phosphate dehydrogenase [Bdellovibrionales bacterium]|nr:glucose-6-phosphate dehydrogenase [Bdellovibrionales bacterium]